MKISAKIIAHSRGPVNDISTFEIVLPKVLLAEFNTHRMLSRNFSSSRAIPTKDASAGDYFEPLVYGKNQPGMVASNEQIYEAAAASDLWRVGVENCRQLATELSGLGLHKQWANRPNDWHTMAKGVVTATDWDNFFYLRDHPDAQPEIRALASLMQIELSNSVPMQIYYGEWHLPYISRKISHKNKLKYYTVNDGITTDLSLEDATKVSISSCAQVSYRKTDDTLEKANRVYDMLNIGSKDKPAHLSPLEHQATPIITSRTFNCPDLPQSWQPGITHVKRNGALMSGNFSGFIQYRQLA